MIQLMISMKVTRIKTTKKIPKMKKLYFPFFIFLLSICFGPFVSKSKGVLLLKNTDAHKDVKKSQPQKRKLNIKFKRTQNDRRIKRLQIEIIYFQKRKMIIQGRLFLLISTFKSILWIIRLSKLKIDQSGYYQMMNLKGTLFIGSTLC